MHCLVLFVKGRGGHQAATWTKEIGIWSGFARAGGRSLQALFCSPFLSRKLLTNVNYLNIQLDGPLSNEHSREALSTNRAAMAVTCTDVSWPPLKHNGDVGRTLCGTFDTVVHLSRVG